MRSLRFALSLLATLPIAASAQVMGRDVEVFTRQDQVASGAWFRFFAPTGDVTVTQASGSQVDLRAEKILRNGRASDIAFVVHRTSDGLTICAIYEDDDECTDNGVRSSRDRDGWNRRSRPPTLAVTIAVPAGVRLRIGSGNGDVGVTGAYAELDASSGNGRVRASGTAGPVRASSGNGALTIEDVRGPVNANSGNGDIRVRATRGPVSANSGNGDLYITMSELQLAGDMDFTTGNGRIELTVPEGLNADVDASTGNGGIQTDFPIQVQGRITRTRLRGTIGQGGRRVRLMSGNGAIELRRG